MPAARPDFERLLSSLAVELASPPFMVIGGQAVLLHGEPRLTQDVGLTLARDPSELADVLDACASIGLRALPEDAAAFVRRTFVLPSIEESTGIRVDFIFSATTYERQAIDRAVPTEIGGQQVPFASAEDLVLHKLFAGRARDLEDAAGVVRRKGSQLDWDYIEQWAARFMNVPGREGSLRRLRT